MEANENSSERKSKQVKVREWERKGSEKERACASSLPRPSSFFPCSPAARCVAPPTEGLEQAINIEDIRSKFPVDTQSFKSALKDKFCDLPSKGNVKVCG